MKIFLVYKEDYPWDVRVEKLALTLSEAGHSVTIIANNIKKDGLYERHGDIEIRRLPKIRWAPARFLRLLLFPIWFNPFWLISLLIYSKGYESPIFVIRDLPLLKTGIICAAFRQGKAILDMAEVYPEMYASSQQFSKKNYLQKLIKNPNIAERYEGVTTPYADHILVMIEESRDRLLKKGIPPKNVTIVSNTPPINKYQGKRHNHLGQRLHIVYVGFLTRLRGLDLLINGVNRFLALGYQKSDIQVDLIGKGSEKETLQKLVIKLGLNDCVTVHGWLEQEKVDELLAKANIGALTYRVCGHWNHTIPNKIFDYMLAGLPVLATPVVPITRIVESTESGLICDGDDLELSIAKNLEKLRNPMLREQLGQNGNKAVRNKYNWENDKQALLTVFESLESNQLPSGTGKAPESRTS